MKKLTILICSILISFNSYGESYICASECYDFEKRVEKICQITYKRTNTGFTNGHTDYLVQEDYSYLLLTHKSTTTGNSPFVNVMLINKLNGDSLSAGISTKRIVDGFDGYVLGGNNLASCTIIP